MNDSKIGGVLNVETLECISFERSKFWGKVFRRIETKEQKQEDEIPLDKFEEIFANDVEQENEEGDDDMDLDADVDIDDDALQDITNRTTIQKCHSIAKNMLMLYSRRGGDIIADDDSEANDAVMKDILDQTRPLIAEHESKWKEAGIDRILNTFDPDKIEEKVGGWLRRNHSINSPIYEKDRMCKLPSNDCCCTPVGDKIRESHTRGLRRYDSDTDTDSLHSIDTARYILSSRKHPDAAYSRHKSSSSSTKMTIKTFRLVKRKRDELRKKYACAEEEPAREHLNDLHSRRSYTQQHRHHHSQQCQKIMYTTPRYKDMSMEKDSPHSYRSCGRHQKSRHTLRKERRQWHRHHSPSGISSDSSSSSICERKRVRCRYSCCENSVSNSSSHRSPCIIAYPYKSCKKDSSYKLASRKRDSISNEIRAKDMMLTWPNERDCHCCKNLKLCKNARYLANCSTEEWKLKNYFTPKMQPQKPLKVAKSEEIVNKRYSDPKHIYASSNVRSKGVSLDAANDNENDKKENKKHVKKVKETKDKTSRETIHKRTKDTKSKPKANKLYKESVKHKSESSDDEEFKQQLHEAIKISKETFETEIKLKTKPALDASESSRQVVPKKKVGPIKRSKSIIISDSDSDDDYCVPSQRINDSSAKIKKYVHKMRKLTVLFEESPTTAGNEESFFVNSNKIYNSTALANATAASRQFCTTNNTMTPSSNAAATTQIEKALPDEKAEKKKVKRMEAVSTTNRGSNHTPPMDTTTSTERSNCTAKKSTKVISHKIIDKNDADNDCTIVSSTTGCNTAECIKEVPTKEESKQKEQPSEKDQNKTSTRVPYPTKEILLYTPHNKSLAPPNAIANGCFSITKEHLSSVIGEKLATKFIKYYTGPRKFSLDHKVFYNPTLKPENIVDSSGSEDGLDSVLSCGCLYATFAG